MLHADSQPLACLTPGSALLLFEEASQGGHLQAMWEVCIVELEEGALKSQPLYPDTYKGAD